MLKFEKFTFWELTFWDQLHLILYPCEQLIWLKNFLFSGLSRFSLFGLHNTRKQKNTIQLSCIAVNAIKSASLRIDMTKHKLVLVPFQALLMQTGDKKLGRGLKTRLLSLYYVKPPWADQDSLMPTHEERVW